MKDFIICLQEVEDEEDIHDGKFYQLLQQLGTPPAVTTLRVNTLVAEKHAVAKQLKQELEKVKLKVLNI